MAPAERERAILERLQRLTRYAWDHAPFYRRKWDEAAFHPDHLRSLEDFESKVPVVTKKDLRDAQTRVPPFGDYLCIPEREVHHIHGTSGTTGRPTAFAIGRDDWDAIANAHARIMWGMGIRPGDTVFVAAIFSLYMGSWGALAGAERLRAKAFPFGAGAPGMTARAAMWLDLSKPAALYATPSFALHLAEVGRSEGYDPRNFGSKTMFFSGEPGASVPGVRDRIVSAYGAQVVDCGSMAEMTPFMHVAGSAQTDGMLCWQDIVYTEVCDPTTFHRVPYGQRGTPVYTHLERTSQPMIRLASGDLTLWDERPESLRTHVSAAAAGHLRTHRRHVHDPRRERLSQRGRRGPEPARRLRRRAPDRHHPRRRDGRVADPHRDRARRRRRGGARCAARRGLAPPAENAGVALADRRRAPGTFPRTDFKARRVIDDREVFRDMNARLRP